MDRIIKTFSNGMTLLYDHGSKDDWRVNIIGGVYSEKYAPKDEDYFQTLIELKEKYGDDVFTFFMEVYERTNENVDKSVLDYIEQQSNLRFKEDNLKVAILYSILYLAMIAEYYYLCPFTRRPSILKKRMKALGVYQILNENMSANEAANFSKGVSAKKLIAECEKRNITL